MSQMKVGYGDKCKKNVWVEAKHQRKGKWNMVDLKFIIVMFRDNLTPM